MKTKNITNNSPFLADSSSFFDYVKSKLKPTLEWAFTPCANLSSILVPAAVCVLFAEQKGLPYIVFIERSHDSPTHAGEIAFPGGKVIASDSNFAHAALRETHEEIGIEPDDIELVGSLRQVKSIRGFDVTPIVGIHYGDLIYTKDPREVESVILVPANVILNANNFEKKELFLREKLRGYYQTFYNGHRIWGVTAQIVVNLIGQLEDV